MNKDMNPKKYHAIIKQEASPQMRENYKLKVANGTIYSTKRSFSINKIALFKI